MLLNFMKSLHKTTKYPIISVIFCVLAIVFNTVQYIKNDHYYLQNKLLKMNVDINNVSPFNFILLIFNLIGINGFLENTVAHILIILVTYLLLGIIELNVGSLQILFILMFLVFFTSISHGLSNLECNNDLIMVDYLDVYCCGSFILMFALGFVLYMVMHHLHGIPKLILLITMIVSWFGCVLYDYYVSYSVEKIKEKRVCKSFNWHALNYCLGIFAGVALAKF